MYLRRAFLRSTSLLALLLISAFCFSAEKEIVEQGQYATVKGNAFIRGTEHSWTLWKLTSGELELEDHFQVDEQSRAMARGFLDPKMPVSNELRHSMSESVAPTEIRATFRPDQSVQSLIAAGVKLDGKPGVGLTCKSSAKEFSCHGTNEKASVRLKTANQVYWWYGIPRLLQSINLTGVGTSDVSQDVILLHFGNGAMWGTTPNLQEAKLTIHNAGPDSLTIGDRTFHVGKFQLEFRSQQQRLLSLTAWTDAKGLVLAVEDARTPEYRVVLTAYKRSGTPK